MLGPPPKAVYELPPFVEIYHLYLTPFAWVPVTVNEVAVPGATVTSEGCPVIVGFVQFTFRVTEVEVTTQLASVAFSTITLN